MNVVEQVAEVEATAVPAPRTITWKHETGCKARRAQSAPFTRAALGWWGAIITGEDATFGMARTFLDRTYPVAWQKKTVPCLDFAPVRAGMLLQLHGYESRNSQEDRFYRVVAIDDAGVELLPLDAGEALAAVRG